MPTLGVGCHVVLVDGEPVLPADQIPTLVDPAHWALPGFARHVSAEALHRPDADRGDRGGGCSTDWGSATQGVRLTHMDTHKHTHVFPAVLRPVLRAGRAAGIRAIRNPFEPEWAVRATARASLTRIAEVTALRTLEPRSRRILTGEGLCDH